MREGESEHTEKPVEQAKGLQDLIDLVGSCYFHLREKESHGFVISSIVSISRLGTQAILLIVEREK